VGNLILRWLYPMPALLLPSGNLVEKADPEDSRSRYSFKLLLVDFLLSMVLTASGVGYVELRAGEVLLPRSRINGSAHCCTLCNSPQTFFCHLGTATRTCPCCKPDRPRPRPASKCMLSTLPPPVLTCPQPRPLSANRGSPQPRPACRCAQALHGVGGPLPQALLLVCAGGGRPGAERVILHHRLRQDRGAAHLCAAAEPAQGGLCHGGTQALHEVSAGSLGLCWEPRTVLSRCCLVGENVHKGVSERLLSASTRSDAPFRLAMQVIMLELGACPRQRTRAMPPTAFWHRCSFLGSLSCDAHAAHILLPAHVAVCRTQSAV
jgi:hypothetical protein